MKVYIVHPQHDYAIEEVFTTRALAEQHRQNLGSCSYYVEEREILDYVPEGGDRYDRYMNQNEKRIQQED